MQALPQQREIEAFLERLRVERRLSPHTLLAYRRELEVLSRMMADQGIDGWQRLDAGALRQSLAAAHRSGLSPRSIQRRLSAWRSLFDYLVEAGHLKASPALGVKAPKQARRLPQVLDVDEASRLVEVEGDDALALRDRAILELFYSSALRLSELCGLRWADIDLGEGELRALGKGRKVRVVPIGRAAREALQAWRAESAGPPDSPVFPGRGGRPLSPRAVQQRLRLRAQQQGVWKRVHPHLLRHSCASHLLESSGDLRGVQELLGHADIGTTQIYTHLDFQHLARVYDAAHPRAKRRQGKD
ncbi:tyrosine recombinase XerC [Pseudomarimonas salicorniae]|uniref:Tyrosine recombinase XerC n=1 Tax=Pseudomarimonas salicorniae TaxID=2933270 RepID=A0ABT0GEH0_9GAMM|nr:tyrosine recombinase XerC [Lysobacter sp. CAU 1642]MCK7592828.1 tyrosine recombinase XerC [Lysobacter sp. CAU 1642]